MRARKPERHNPNFAKAVVRYLDASKRGTQERIAEKLGINSASISGWRVTGGIDEENFEAFLRLVPGEVAAEMRDAWLQDHSPPEVWRELVALRAQSHGAPSEIAKLAEEAAAVLKKYKEDPDAYEKFPLVLGAIAAHPDLMQTLVAAAALAVGRAPSRAARV